MKKIAFFSILLKWNSSIFFVKLLVSFPFGHFCHLFQLFFAFFPYLSFLWINSYSAVYSQDFAAYLFVCFLFCLELEALIFLNCFCSFAFTDDERRTGIICTSCQQLSQTFVMYPSAEAFLSNKRMQAPQSHLKN